MNQLSPSAQLALDTILQNPVRGIPTIGSNIMEHAYLERLAGREPGSYAVNPEEVYLACQRNVGANLIIQWIPDNPLSMGSAGYDGAAHGATTGAERITLDGMEIDTPEAVIEHLEKFTFPRLIDATESFDDDARARQIVADEARVQRTLAPDILKTPYGVIGFPTLEYFTYGYANYFMAFALYPEIMERHFSLQADYMIRNNRAVARAYRDGNLPPLGFLDHDMADSRGTLVNVKMLDDIWFPHFARALEPVIEAGLPMMWHCDGNLMEMIPRLIDVGLKGFQGFQYEDGMDYERICRTKAKDGSDLLIIAGVSVTRTLPMGAPDDVRREVKWLVENGPRTGLFLAASSSITPGVPWENLRTMLEGFEYYRTHGRQ